MVLQYSHEEMKSKMEKSGCISPASQLRRSFSCNLAFIQNWHLLLYVLLAGSNNETDKDLYFSTLDNTSSKKTHSGGKHSAQSSDNSLLPGLHDDTASDILAWASRSDYPKLACLNKKFNSLIASGYLYRLRRRLGVIEHWIYLACILMPWEGYDPQSQRWMRLPRMPCDECFNYADKESLAVGTQLLVFGRELSGFAIWMFGVITREWSRCSLMNLPRCLFGSSSLGEIAIVAGGVDKNGRILKTAELYNSELGAWEILPDMNLPRKLCSGFFMDGKFYVVGGMSLNSQCLTCGEEFDMETMTWRRIENMYPNVGLPDRSPAMRSPPLVAVVNNQLYCADQATNEVKKYNKVNNSWSFVKMLPLRADSSNGWGLAFKACGKSLLVIGGHRGAVVLHSWEPEVGESGEWEVLSVRERAGASFVSNCAVMGC